MRLLFTILLLALVFGLVGFILTNDSTTVPITVWQQQYEDVPIFTVVLASVLIGVIFTGIFGVAEGAKIRLENRRLRRQLHRLETEVNYLRTQPASPPMREPDDLDPPAAPTPARTRGAQPPSAPIYGAGAADDDDDDVYSGGRAV